LRFSEIFRDKTCLIVLDDIWDIKHVVPFMNGLGSRCRALLTTRDITLAGSLGAREQRIGNFDDDDALELLAQWSAQGAASLPDEARAVAKECGNLPFE